MPITVSRKVFARLVEEALASIPELLRARMDNVGIVIEEWPTREQLEEAGVEPDDHLFGLYEGTPLIERGILADPLLPDRISIFRGPLTEACDSAEEIREEVRRTVIHEVAHHFGMGEDALSDLGYD
ncbi:MAG TPA: metallopeptidase family protein [bacterium]|nr:metallopeptidase family protein [bacterium]